MSVLAVLTPYFLSAKNGGNLTSSVYFLTLRYSWLVFILCFLGEKRVQGLMMPGNKTVSNCNLSVLHDHA